MSLLCLASLGWLSSRLDDPLSRWITHITIKLVLAIGWELSQGCELSGLVPSHVVLLGLPFSMVNAFQEWAFQESKVEVFYNLAWEVTSAIFFWSNKPQWSTLVHGEGAQSSMINERSFKIILQEKNVGQELRLWPSLKIKSAVLFFQDLDSANGTTKNNYCCFLLAILFLIFPT